jgi:hypothetical protein
LASRERKRPEFLLHAVQNDTSLKRKRRKTLRLRFRLVRQFLPSEV